MTDTLRSGSYELNDRQRANLGALALQAYLRERVRGEVRFDAGTRTIYAHDSSNYRQVPFGVVIPEDEEDVVEALKVCHAHGRRTCRAARGRASPGRGPTSPTRPRTS
jgi:FAD/FMN-containing dehydrogenase